MYRDAKMNKNTSEKACRDQRQHSLCRNLASNQACDADKVHRVKACRYQEGTCMCRNFAAISNVGSQLSCQADKECALNESQSRPRKLSINIVRKVASQLTEHIECRKVFACQDPVNSGCKDCNEDQVSLLVCAHIR